jgi:hypothetical protein
MKILRRFAQKSAVACDVTLRRDTVFSSGSERRSVTASGYEAASRHAYLLFVQSHSASL